MKSTTLIVLLALLAPQATPSAFRATIEGIVRDGSTNQPMAGVNVYLIDYLQLQPVSTTPFATTDSQGVFALSVNSPGRYRVLPQRSDFVYARPARVRSFQAGVIVSVTKENVSKIELTMIRQGVITGQIFDPTGRPLSGVPTNLFVRNYDHTTGKLEWLTTGGPLGLRQVFTNDRGEYRYFDLQPGDYIIGASGPSVPPLHFYPGVKDASLAELVHINSGEETRLSPMIVEDPNKAVRVHFRYKDPDGKLTQKGFNVGTTISSFFSWGTGSRVEPEIVLSMTRGYHELILRASSRDNDLLYASVKVDVGNEELFLNPEFKPGHRVTGTLRLEGPTGGTFDTNDIQCLLTPETEGATAQSKAPGCIGGQFSPGFYRLSMNRVPPDAFVASARSGDRNVLADGIQLERDTQLDIVLATPGSRIDGIVTDDIGEALAAAVVALVPDSPLENAQPQYRSDISTYDGSFELRGIAPGSYRLIAWRDLPGAAYLNADFMKAYEGKGTSVRIDAAKQLSMNVKVVE
jgi:hypothetical protein